MKIKSVLFCLIAFALPHLASAAGIDRFDEAKPVWPTGLEKERNLFIGFKEKECCR